MWGEIISNLIFALAVLVPMVSLIVLVKKSYRVIPANEVGIISGALRRQRIPETGEVKNYTILKGGGAFVWPAVNQLYTLSLAPRKIETTVEVRTNEYIHWELPVVLVFHINAHDDYQLHAAISLFSQEKDDYVSELIQDLLTDRLQAIVATMSYEDVHKERSIVQESTGKVIQEKLDELGLKVMSLAIQGLRVKDEDDPFAAKAKLASDEINREIKIKSMEEEARIRKAEANKEIDIVNMQKEQRIAGFKAREEEEKERHNSEQNMLISEQEAIASKEIQIKEIWKAFEIAKRGAEKEVKVKTEEALSEEGISEQKKRKTLDIAAREATRDIRIKDEEASRDEICKEQERIVAKVRTDNQIKLEKEEARRLEGLREIEVTQILGINTAEADREVGVKQKGAEHQVRIVAIGAAREEQIREQEVEKEVAENKKALLKARDEMKAIEFDTNFKAQRAELLPRVLAEKEQRETEANMRKAVLVIESLARLSVAENDRNAKIFEAEGELRLVQAEADGQKAKLIADADGKKAKLIAKADALRAQLFAKADSQAALLDAFKEVDEASKFFLFFNETLEQFPEILRALMGEPGLAGVFGEIAKPLGQIDSIRIVDFAGQNGAASRLSELAEVSPQIVLSFLSKFQAAGFGNIIKKLGISNELLDLLEKKVSGPNDIPINPKINR
uniref:Uncharacterized membrane protein YqiK, contains Band7/PHB/SPFH domain n=1 Tax=Candidatus Kentrum sp. FM TaxID=2126340 RepID=A0A450RXU0_9GAMM|nr:MAG: Uncharacterized membrane protein YqiK, contains Band7/PHB/SPFH domain [Candidatus Kentron sp. FM]VFJ43940.1 MAG: Uncharacterized membrane protein YqiK, contains Band7/PHB/SPFH domain [Candidatus Kentron sp. FM]VFK06184.1 MAG: Uncharacterized membrane protein YqiK, contains Band7/PHB/SPFH domain [Candidatus Kentron sp. FM]